MSRKPPVAIIVGAGPGLSASLARRLAAEGYALALAARNTVKLDDLVAETGAGAIPCDATKPGDVERLFGEAAATLGPPDVVLNAGARAAGPVADLDPTNVERVVLASAMDGFLVSQAAARAMLPRGSGTLLFTGASASIKGYANSAPFAMAKFALRGLVQSLARKLGPCGIHVAHVIVDGGIRSAARPEPADRSDAMLDPDAIAGAFLHLVGQPRSVWSHELDLRPWVERF